MVSKFAAAELWRVVVEATGHRMGPEQLAGLYSGIKLQREREEQQGGGGGAAAAVQRAGVRVGMALGPTEFACIQTSMDTWMVQAAALLCACTCNRWPTDRNQDVAAHVTMKTIAIRVSQVAANPHVEVVPSSACRELIRGAEGDGGSGWCAEGVVC
jgi:hypothetical protein